MTFKSIFDPLIYQKFEGALKIASDKHMTARIAFGALYAYYKTNQGTRYGIDFWESKLEDNIQTLHAQEIWQLMVAFRDNR
jgi:hypothetical protein